MIIHKGNYECLAGTNPCEIPGSFVSRYSDRSFWIFASFAPIVKPANSGLYGFPAYVIRRWFLIISEHARTPQKGVFRLFEALHSDDDCTWISCKAMIGRSLPIYTKSFFGLQNPLNKENSNFGGLYFPIEGFVFSQQKARKCGLFAFHSFVYVCHLPCAAYPLSTFLAQYVVTTTGPILL